MSIQEYTDEELVVKYKETRNHQFLTELFTRHSDIIYRNALRKMKNPADAEDIVQIAYIKMVTDLFNYKGTGSIIGWMLQVVIFTCYDRLRSEKSRVNRDKKIMSERVQMTTPKNNELTEIIEAHLNKLPEIYKLPITLQFMDGLTVKEVADTLDIPEKTIRSQIARGLEKLKSSLQSVGVTASVISVGEMIKEIQQPMAPEIFKSNQYFSSLYQSKAATSTKLAITTGSKGFFTQSILGVLILATVSVAVVWGWLHVSKEKSELLPTKIPEVSKVDKSSPISQKWDFENFKDLEEYKGISLITGKISLVENIGVKGSSALLAEEGTVFEIDISNYNLPIKVTYQTDVAINTKNPILGSFQDVFRKNYKAGQKIYSLYGLMDPIDVDPQTSNKNFSIGFTGSWYSHVSYVDEKYVDSWFHGKRSQYKEGFSEDKSKILIYIGEKSIIDDLKIESIEKKELPDISIYKKIVSDVVYKSGVENYNIDKSKIGLNNVSKLQPTLAIKTTENFEYFRGLRHEVSYPYISSKGKVEWLQEPQKLSKTWTFEKYEQLYDFKLINGEVVFMPGNGENKSNCIGISPDSVIELDISKFKLPIKISFEFDIIIPKGQISKGFVLTKGSYQEDKNILSFIKLHKSANIDVTKINNRNANAGLGFLGDWFPAQIYVTDNCVDIWFYGNRTGVVFGTSTNNQKLYFNVKDRAIIDNFKIESIEQNEAPDISSFRKFAEQTPIVKGIKDYYKLETQKEPLNLEKNSQAEVSICDYESLKKSLGLNIKFKVDAGVENTPLKKAYNPQ